MASPLTKWGVALQQRDFAAIADWFTAHFFGVAAVALILAGIAAGLDVGVARGIGDGAATGLRVLMLGTLLAGASTICGWLLGLLFGVPRTLARAQISGGNGGATPSAAAANGGGDGRSPTSRVNTNLEDISDWLTKTIVGVGLTQLFTIPGHLWRFAGQLNESGFSWSPYGQLLALSLLLYFAPGGFWLGYVGTRTILTKLFDAIDRLDIDPHALGVAAEPANLRLDPATKRVASPDNSVAGIDRVLLQTPIQTLQTSREVAAWGAAQARSGNLQAGQTALEQAIKTDPGNRAFKEQLATIYSALDKGSDADRLVREVPDTSIAVYRALYEPRPHGFQKAIRVGEKLLTRSGQQHDASLHTWLSAAYGQQYCFEREQGSDAETLLQIKANVLRHVQAAISADATSRGLLYGLWRPESGSADDDLSCFPPDDVDLVRLLGP